MPLWGMVLLDNIAKLSGLSIFFRQLFIMAVANDFQFRVRRSISHRCMMRTKKGYLGLAPAVTQLGDRISLLKGLKAPVVLRPKGEAWELVGECYIHGIMNGEAFDPDECRALWLA